MTNNDKKDTNLPEDETTNEQDPNLENEQATVDEVNAEPAEPTDEVIEEAADAPDNAVEGELLDGDEESEESAPEEEVLPLLPLKATVILPNTVVPLAAQLPRSLKLIDAVMQGDRAVAMVMQKDDEQNDAGPDDILNVGAITTIHQMMRMPDGSVRLAVQGLERMEIIEIVEETPYLMARVRRTNEQSEDSLEIQALSRTSFDLFEKLVELVPHLPDELVVAALNVNEDPVALAYLIGSHMRMEPKDRQQLLETLPLADKLRFLNGLLTQEIEVLELGRKIQTDVQEEMGKNQREYFLREQLKAIQRELGETSDQEAEINELREQIEQSGMPEEARKEADRELDRLSKLPPAAAEYGVIKTYLDWLVSLPWNTSTEGEIDIKKTRETLDEDHYGLDKIKDRILEYLAVRKLKQDQAAENGEDSVVHREPILVFVGPPGVGKTSLAQSIARALGRELTRMSLGGVRDESEIRGHRRTYVGAMPGRIIQAIRRAGTNDPVFVLDEVDKLGSDWRGDPSSALLEVLDPEQNPDFRDHYLDVPFDLSKVMFIATANMLDTIPAPLRDRMEIVELSSYTDDDKLQIAKKYLVPKQMKANAVADRNIEFEDEALLTIIQHYTREAGVRNLEREIGTAARKIATKVAEGADVPTVITRAEVREYLGRPRFFYEELEQRTSQPGVAIGVGVNAYGGDIMFIEATKMPGKGNMVVTGQLGDVMKESAQAAFSFVRSRARELGISEDFHKDLDIHIHVPAGAVPKDGPSAGVAITTALVSLLSGVPVRGDVAMTGEFTLRGQVLPVGGIKEKALGALRAGCTTFILPKRNEVDLDDLPDEVRDQLTVVLADTLDDALAVSMPEEFHDVRAARAPEPATA